MLLRPASTAVSDMMLFVYPIADYCQAVEASLCQTGKSRDAYLHYRRWRVNALYSPG
jgi:hypothetical protein